MVVLYYHKRKCRHWPDSGVETYLIFLRNLHLQKLFLFVCFFEDLPPVLLRTLYLVFTRTPGMSYRRRLSSVLCLSDFFGTLSISNDPLIIQF